VSGLWRKINGGVEDEGVRREAHQGEKEPA
jgi:hypothetical protein